MIDEETPMSECSAQAGNINGDNNVNIKQDKYVIKDALNPTLNVDKLVCIPGNSPANANRGPVIKNKNIYIKIVNLFTILVKFSVRFDIKIKTEPFCNILDTSK